MTAGDPTAGLVIATLNTLQPFLIGAPPGFDFKAVSRAHRVRGAKGTAIRQAAQTLQHLTCDLQLMKGDDRIIRRLIALQHCLMAMPPTEELLRNQGWSFVGINTGAMLSYENGMIKATAAVPQQHQTMAPIAPEKSELGIGSGPGGNVKRSPRKTATGEETQLRVPLMERLGNPFHRIPLTLALGIIRPEQQLKLYEGIVPCKGELRWLPTFQPKIPIERVKAALPDAAVEQKQIPLP